jgi:sugar phosphate isomerase/epimerase
MARLSMNEMTTFRWSFDEDVANYAAAGIEAMGVWRRKLSDFGEERGIELLAQQGMSVSNLLWAGGFTGSDGRSFRESVDDALDAIRLAAQMRAHCLVLYSGARAGHTHNHARRLLREAMREIAPVAADYDVTLAMEPMNSSCAAEWTFLTSLDETLQLLDAMECPQVKLALDTYHVGLEPGLVERLGELAPRIAVVHLGDCKETPDAENNRCRLGQGRVPLREIIAALEKAGYQGYFDVELLGEEIEATDYRELIEHSKQAFCRLAGVCV